MSPIPAFKCVCGYAVFCCVRFATDIEGLVKSYKANVLSQYVFLVFMCDLPCLMVYVFV